MKKAKTKNHCKKCGKCCSYFCLEIDAPKERSDFEDLTWMIAHKGVSYHIDGKNWYMMVHNKCRFFDKAGYCEIYDNRPKICRNHVPGECDQNVSSSGDYNDADFVINSYEELIKYRDSLYRPKTRRRLKTKDRRP